jgi:uncharacterized protein (TIGR02246 family)
VLAVAAAIDSLRVRAVPLVADSTDETALRAALDRAAAELGPPDVVVYNAAIIQADSPGELSVRAHQDAWAVNVVGAITAAAHVLPGMARRGGGSFIITGGMPEPKPQYVSLSLGKAGVRTLVALLDQEYRASGVHVATVTIAGAVAPGTAFDPDDIAEHYWRLHTEPPQRWKREIIHAESTPVDGVRNVLTKILGDWQAAFNEHQVNDLCAMFTEDALFQGVSPQPVVGRAAIRRYYDNVAEGTTARVEVLEGTQLRENIVTGIADVTFTTSEGDAMVLRLSIVAEHVAGTWSIRHYHAAAPMTTAR